jgi:hypothetical protein
MPKLPECAHCQFYADSSYTVCAVHPSGVDSDSCLDFREDPNAEPEELWEPEGANYIDGELVIERAYERAYYNGEEIAQPQQRLTSEEQWKILETHPFFTGVCPDCGYQFPPHVPELIHFDCTRCGWIDEEV